MDMNISKSQIREEMHKQWATKSIDLALMGRWDEAVQSNQQILKLFPNDIQALNRLGKAYQELGRYEEAAAAYEQCLEKQPSNAIARKRLSELYAIMQREPARTLASAPTEAETGDEEADDLDPFLEEEDSEPSMGEESAA